MAQFYAPEIVGKIPAQYGNEFRFSFIPSRANPTTQLAIKIKHLTTDTVYISDVRSQSVDFNQEKNEWFCTFDLNEVEFQDEIKPISKVLSIGTYYKVQVAHCDENTVGTYSAVGIFKYTGIPSLNIEWNDNSITCEYSNEDRSENIDWYKINIYDAQTDKLIDSSEQIYNNGGNLLLDETTGSISFNFSPTIINDGVYKCDCVITTFNKIEFPYVSIDKEILLDSDSASCVYNIFPDEGIIILELSGLGKDEYRLLRRSSNSLDWEILHSFIGDEGTIKLVDKSCEQYEQYDYGVQRNGYKVVPIVTDIVCDFEDCFLSDSERQLKIRFNPKVNNFKRNIQESKNDTIGGIYPIFFRNGKINYFEFSINGLISMRMDDNKLFQSTNLLFDMTQRPATPSEDNEYIITKGKEFQLERQFKRDVYDWLTNGKPKLFRSSTEGNFIVRLMNVNLTPEEQLSRMLHSFQATAYEIAPCTIKNLSVNEYNLAIME